MNSFPNNFTPEFLEKSNKLLRNKTIIALVTDITSEKNIKVLKTNNTLTYNLKSDNSDFMSDDTVATEVIKMSLEKFEQLGCTTCNFDFDKIYFKLWIMEEYETYQDKQDSVNRKHIMKEMESWNFNDVIIHFTRTSFSINKVVRELENLGWRVSIKKYIHPDTTTSYKLVVNSNVMIKS